MGHSNQQGPIRPRPSPAPWAPAGRHIEDSPEGQRNNEPAPPGRPQSGTDAQKIEARRRISLSSRSRLFSDFSRDLGRLFVRGAGACPVVDLGL